MISSIKTARVLIGNYLLHGSSRSSTVLTATTRDSNLSNFESRPLIFLWPKKDQPPKVGSGTFVRLPKCDVVYQEEAESKTTKRRKTQNSYHYLADEQSEDRIIKHYLRDETDLSNRSNIFCVYNAGDSNLPQKLLDAKASRVMVLESPKAGYLRKWQTLAADPSHDEKLIAKAYDFNRLQAARIRDFHNNQGVDSLCQLFMRTGATTPPADDPRAWWGNTDETKHIYDAPIRIIGVPDPYREHGLFATLLYCRSTRSSIYEFGPIELLCAVTPQQYLDFHPRSAAEEVSQNGRSSVPKPVRWRARLYHYLFEIDLISKEEYTSFEPEISVKDRLKFEREGIRRSIYEELRVDKDCMYWLRIRPRRCDELETLVSQEYIDHNESDTEQTVDVDQRRQFRHLAGFVYMYKLLSRHKKEYTIREFIQGYFPGHDFSNSDSIQTVDHGTSAITLQDLVKTYERLALDGGQFYNSTFYREAQEFIDGILCPSGNEPKVRDRKKA